MLRKELINDDNKICQDHRDIVYQYIAHGTSLDDVKAEMEKEKREGYDLFKQGFNYAIDTLFYILDNIGKGDKE